MNTRRKSGSTTRSTPQKPQINGNAAPEAKGRAKSTAKAAVEHEHEQIEQVETEITAQSIQRKRKIKDVEVTALKEEDEGIKLASRQVKQEAALETWQEVEDRTITSSPKKKTRKTKAKGEQQADPGSAASPEKNRNKAASGPEENFEEQRASSTKKGKKKNEAKGEEEANEQGEKKVKRRRKTKEEREAEAMPLAARTNGLRMFIGAHVSCAKGVHNSVTNAVHIGGNAFAMFLKSQRKWENPPLQDEHRDQFRAFCGEHKYDAACHILPHGSYLVNLAQEDPDRADQGYNAFLDDLQRCDALGIKLYNFHPGWTGSAPRPAAIGRIAKALNRAHAATTIVTPLLEAMAGSGNVIGSTFEDLRDIIALVEDKARIGVCIDTCHIFAAGYDLRSPQAFKETLDKFDQIVGMKYLRALHVNDSKAPLDSHRDLHQNLGLGFLGLRAFHNLMNEKRFEGLPLVLETPIDRKDENGKDIEDKGIWAREIKMLEALIGMDAESEGFKRMEKELADQGAEERDKYQEAFERKKLKEMKKGKSQTKLSFGKEKSKVVSKHSVDENNETLETSL
ncbi:MAG: hypothetical protein Q9163_003105 [Psora crenata]